MLHLQVHLSFYVRAISCHVFQSAFRKTDTPAVSFQKVCMWESHILPKGPSPWYNKIVWIIAHYTCICCPVQVLKYTKIYSWWKARNLKKSIMDAKQLNIYFGNKFSSMKRDNITGCVFLIRCPVTPCLCPPALEAATNYFPILGSRLHGPANDWKPHHAGFELEP